MPVSVIIPTYQEAATIAETVRAVRAGQPTPIPAEDCFTVTEVVLQARDAAEAGKLVELPRPG